MKMVTMLAPNGVMLSGDSGDCDSVHDGMVKAEACYKRLSAKLQVCLRCGNKCWEWGRCVIFTPPGLAAFHEAEKNRQVSDKNGLLPHWEEVLRFASECRRAHDEMQSAYWRDVEKWRRLRAEAGLTPGGEPDPWLDGSYFNRIKPLAIA